MTTPDTPAETSTTEQQPRPNLGDHAFIYLVYTIEQAPNSDATVRLFAAYSDLASANHMAQQFAAEQGRREDLEASSFQAPYDEPGGQVCESCWWKLYQNGDQAEVRVRSVPLL